MKRTIITTLIILASVTTTNLMAQAPPPPPPNHGSTGNQNGGNAPIGSGLGILLAAAGVYGIKKYYKAKAQDTD